LVPWINARKHVPEGMKPKTLNARGVLNFANPKAGTGRHIIYSFAEVRIIKNRPWKKR
jgi:hypothetical protein